MFNVEDDELVVKVKIVGVYINKIICKIIFFIKFVLVKYELFNVEE